MNPCDQFCPNPDCKARGEVGAGNINVHSKKERRYFCKRCNKTFSETKGTPFYYQECSLLKKFVYHESQCG